MGPDVMTVEDFLDRGLLLLDRDIQQRVEKAASNGNVLRYVCVIEGQRYLFFLPSYFVFIQAFVSHFHPYGFLLFHVHFKLCKCFGNVYCSKLLILNTPAPFIIILFFLLFLGVKSVFKSFQRILL
jgi:hypothetical protein